jgi:CRISPR-associated endonuclease/helicase Cas3
MKRELEALVEFHTALGGSTIILSATLPISTRRRLAAAYRKGVSGSSVTGIDLQASDYPLVTIIGSESAIEKPLPIREGLARFVTSTRVDDVDSALARVVRAAKAGACVAFVRNSVDGAIDTWNRLRGMGFDPLLFHARFAMSDRQQSKRR